MRGVMPQDVWLPPGRFRSSTFPPRRKKTYANLRDYVLAVCGKRRNASLRAQRSYLAFNKIDNFEIASSLPLLAMTFLAEFFRKLLGNQFLSGFGGAAEREKPIIAAAPIIKAPT